MKTELVTERVIKKIFNFLCQLIYDRKLLVEYMLKKKKNIKLQVPMRNFWLFEMLERITIIFPPDGGKY